MPVVITTGKRPPWETLKPEGLTDQRGRMVMKAISIHGVSAFQAFCVFFDSATGAFDPGRGCVGLPGLKTIWV
jgi:hypothetical protein